VTVFPARLGSLLALAVAVVAGPAPLSAQTQSASPLRITVLFDNTVANARLQSAWGFAALIEHRGHTLLLDAGSDARVFGANLDSLHVDVRRIEAVAVSHAHSDHTGGLEAVPASAVRVPLYGLPSFPGAFRQRYADRFRVVDTERGQELSPGVFTTGEMVDPAVRIPEQALVIPTDSGLVIITGCAHPGIVAIVQRAVEMHHAPAYLVLGGFHLVQHTDAQVDEIIAEFRRLGVRKVGATHCTGDRAIARFAAAWGADFVRLGAGRVLVVGS